MATKRNNKSESEIPSTILRSDEHAQRTWRKAHDSAVGTYGEGGRAHRVAYAALKHEYEKRGDRWVRKGKRGPSDPRAARGHREAGETPTARGKVARTEDEARKKAKQARKEYGEDYRRRKKKPAAKRKKAAAKKKPAAKKRPAAKKKKAAAKKKATRAKKKTTRAKKKTARAKKKTTRAKKKTTRAKKKTARAKKKTS